jgi:ATP-dependent DNA helicase RecG
VIQDKVHFHKLGLVITDEQHRFGVRQRETLIAKGEENCQVPPHVLVMSATPIPRTLAIILYGDLDISVIDEKPANRLPIKNCVIGANRRKKAYEFIINQVKEGHQAYVICPLVEESQQMDGENVKDYADKLRTELPPAITVGILHGRMKASEKNQVMEDFSAGRIQVLVSTTVVEVGVDVPNATVMVIENAERFGLAQLHQLRGRIGRGKDQSYCIFINGSDASKVKRLEILNRSNDGFEIASEDLKLRGPGDIFGIRQSGIMEFTLGDIYTDAGILKEASQAADKLLREDYGLDQPSHKGLRQRLEVYMDAQIEKISL